MAVDRVGAGAAVAFWLFPLPSQSESVYGVGWLDRGTLGKKERRG
jgi:hypothetical protein